MRLPVVLSFLAICLLPRAYAGEGLLERAMKGKAKMIDLGYPLNSKTAYWPAENYKPFEFHAIATLEKNGVNSGAFEMPEHQGTHVDAPNHFERGQRAVDQLTWNQLIAPAVVIDVKAKANNNADYQLTVADITRWEKKHGRIPKHAIVFMHTGWGARYWELDRYKNADAEGVFHFPGFSTAVTEFLVRRRAIVALGIDTLSVDFGPSRDFKVHHISHSAGKYHIEHTAHLEQLPPRGAIVLVAPIKIEGGSGGPARVVAFVP